CARAYGSAWFAYW
nr:immunoglobulin heavy chain junction region [Mus musculus]